MSALQQTVNVKAILVHYLTAMWRRRWPAILACWAVCIGGWGWVMTLPRQYDSQGRFYVDVDSLLTPLLSGIAIDVNPVQQLDYLRNTLLSRPNLEQVIHLAGLDDQAGTPAQKDSLLDTLARDVSIKPQTSNLYVITFRSRDPIIAKNVVQSLLTLFSQKTSESNRSEMDNAQRFLSGEIARYESLLRAAEQRRAQFHQQYMHLLPGAGATVSHLETMRQTVHQEDEAYHDAVTKRDALRSELTAVPQFLSVNSNPIIISNGRMPQTPSELRLDEARKNLDTLRLRFTDQHPDVVAMQRQVEQLEAKVASDRSDRSDGSARASPWKSQVTNPVYEQLKVRLVDAEGSLAAAKRRLEDSRAQLAEIETNANLVPEIEAKAEDLDRDYGVIKHNYEALLQRREAATLGQSADTKADKLTFRIVDPPQVPIAPSTPNRPLLFSIVLLLGCGSGAGLALLLTQIDQSFASASQLRELGLPVLGTVAYIASQSSRSTYIARTAGFAATALILLAIYGGLIVVSTGIYPVVV
jgi:polysaccharide chain length determinant protein (PEP-CTERM system associated)